MVLLVLSVAAVVHRFDNKAGDKTVLLNEWSEGAIELDSENDFDFN